MNLTEIERDLDDLENQRRLCRRHGVQEWRTQVAKLRARAREATDDLERRVYLEAARRLQTRADAEELLCRTY
jgi:predicted secreted protein